MTHVCSFLVAVALVLGTSALRRPASDKSLVLMSDVILTGTLSDVDSFKFEGRSYFIGYITVDSVAYGAIRPGARIPLIWSLGWSRCYDDWNKVKGKKHLWCLNRSLSEPAPGSVIEIGARSLYSKLPVAWADSARKNGLYEVTFSEGVQSPTKLETHKALLREFPVRIEKIGPVRYPIVRLTYRNSTDKTIEFPAIYVSPDGVTLCNGAELQLVQRTGIKESVVTPRNSMLRSGGSGNFSLRPGDEQLIDVDLVSSYELKPGSIYIVKFQPRKDLQIVETHVFYVDGVKSRAWQVGFDQ